ncbi:type VI secretion system tube protein Hcp [Variovorax ginsengisoli]|uniref:Type VI protein secretion system component Hcp n=1 Tax=Variovorax ginsengisoli TaxID=363844 RepID=A0ABT9SCD3_9BURK|nr:type VI secretion system tube protein Hcp [Variovorax ginsengisoli]MDP9901042.1 type VI protein secretion system component Hcp [Variovorax ginsengisoli]
MSTFSRLHMQLTDADTNLPMVGESADQTYSGQIQLARIAWDMSRAAPRGLGLTRGKSQPEAFSFSKVMDQASTAMLTKMRHGVRLRAVVTLDSPEDSGFKLTLTLNNARIAEYKVDINDGEKSGAISEDWTFTYDEIAVEYMPTAKETLTTRHKRAPGAESGKASLDAVLEAFKALNEARRIDVSATLKKEYPKLFAD